MPHQRLQTGCIGRARFSLPLCSCVKWRLAGGYAIGRWVVSLCLCAALHGASDGPTLSARDVVNSADYSGGRVAPGEIVVLYPRNAGPALLAGAQLDSHGRSEEHTSELQSLRHLVCRLLLEKKRQSE